jgi:predicted transcriptional regulator
VAEGTDSHETELIELTVEVVSAYVSNNSVPVGELAGLISSVYASLKGKAGSPAPREAVELVPAVPIKKSVTPDYIVCLEDGKKFKSVKRHLSSRHGLTPDQYREKWSLPGDYPMVAPNYAEARSALAKIMGLGRKSEEPTPPKRRRKKPAA